jgi:RNA polymerase sigma-70 factor (ECF subfamily)
VTAVELEEALVRRSQAGDLDAFNRLIELHQNAVFGLCVRMLGSREAAEDASQEAFLSAFTHVGTFRQGSFKSWMMRIAANAAYDELRRRGRRPTTSIDFDQDEESGPIAVPDPGPVPEELALRSELRRAVEDGLQTLPDDQRLAVILCDIQQLAYEEIAEATQSSLGTVKSRISRGRARLREYLRAQGELLPEQLR